MKTHIRDWMSSTATNDAVSTSPTSVATVSFAERRNQMVLKLRATLLVLLSLTVILTVFVGIAGAQSIDGTLRGEVTDPSGAVIVGAKVTATNVATNVSAETTTSASGTYNFPNLLPGMYKVTVEISGFEKYTREQIQVRTNQV